MGPEGRDERGGKRRGGEGRGGNGGFPKSPPLKILDPPLYLYYKSYRLYFIRTCILAVCITIN